MHPLVTRYVETDLPAISLAREISGPTGPLLSAFREMAMAWDRRDWPGASRAGESVSLNDLAAEKGDPDLLILFLTFWAECALKARRTAECRALVNRARQLSSDTTPPKIRAYTLHMEGNLAGSEGNNRRREDFFNEAIAVLPETYPQRRSLLWFRALFLARLGRGVEVEEDLKRIEGIMGSGRDATVSLARFVAAVFAGRGEEAEALLPQIEREIDLLRDVGVSFRAPRVLLDLMRQPAPSPANADGAAPGGLRDPPPWARTVQALLNRQTEDGLRWGRRSVETGFSDVSGADFPARSLVRSELAAGNGEAARRLLDLAESRGNRYFLDDFFQARVELLAGNRREAARRFAEALGAAEKFRAQGMLDFEARLACEVSAGDFIGLTRDALGPASAARLEAAAPAPVPAAPPAPATPAPEEAALIGTSVSMNAVRESIQRFAPLEVPVLILGETGTGKELAARALHDSGPKPREPFLAINCGAIAETLLETELFGHERGAFTGADRAHRGLFEEAGRGTLFLDEIGEIPPRLQVVLLRVIETGEFFPVGSARPRKSACRIVAATNAPLERLEEAGRFRKDLLFRLRRLTIEIPPLRERRDDILPLAGHFLDLHRRRGAHAAMSRELKDALLRYDWPGNVRELRHEIERMRLLNSDRLSYGVEDLEARIRGKEGGEARKDRGENPAEGRPGGGPPSPAGAPEEFGAEAALERRLGREAAGGPPRRTGPASAEPPGFPAETPGRGTEKTPERLAREAPSVSARGPASVEEVFEQEHSARRRRDRLRALFARYREFTRREVARILGVSPATAATDLKALADEGLIDRIEPTRSHRTYYFTLRAPR